MSEAGLNGIEVAAPVEFDCKSGSGAGKLVEIAAKGARIAGGGVAVGSGENVALRYRFFATSTPVKMTAEVKEGSEDGFVAHFTNVDPILKNMLRLILRKLKNRPASEISTEALLRDN